jgi:protein-S-isoprenylcysteine O-methyltransferase Ste14
VNATEVANPGLIRPPFVYLVAIALGVMLQLAMPLPFFAPALGMVVGVSLGVVAMALFVSSVGKFRAAGTAVPANRPTTAIVRAGPYRFSRNPIYLAFSLLHLGIAIWVNSLWLLATLAAALALMHIVIRREERYLERKFGAEYLEYKASVRRWL